MRIEQGEERGEINIPLADVVKDGGGLNILPNVKKYFSVDYKPKNNTLTLVAGGFIGLIPINESLAVDIRPKFSISNLTRIVSVAEDKFNTLDFFSKNYSEQPESSQVVFEFMVECLCNELRALYSEGIWKEYMPVREDSHRIKGRICFNQSINQLWAHGHFNKAVIEYYNLIADTPFNRLIKYVLNYCILELKVISSENNLLRDELIESLELFDAVEFDAGRRFMPYVQESIRNEKIPLLRHYYTNICEICRLIITQKGVDVRSVKGKLSMSSFTLDMAHTFEQYLLNSLRLQRTSFASKTLILDGNREGKKKFYNQPSKGQGDAKPDIIIKRENQHLVIADAKYKVSPKESDRYQVISHALSYGAKVAVLVMPKSIGRTAPPLVKLGAVGKEYEIAVYEYYIDLSSDDLEAEEALFASEMEKLSRAAGMALTVA